MDINKSYVIIEELQPEDWILGSADFGKAVVIEDGDWTPHWPSNEKQRQGFESMACTNFSSTTTIEVMFTEMIKNKKIAVGNMDWLHRHGYFDKEGHINFSDRFDAILSGTGPNGNSLKNPAETKRKYGLIPEKMLPWTNSKSEYFNKIAITQEMLQMGQEFLKRFPINYERVSRREFEKALKYSPLVGALYAWNGTKDGIYFRVSNRVNHAICILKPPHVWKVGDSYDPFIKKLGDDYIFLHYAYRYIIRENVIEEPEEKDMLKTIKAKSDPRIFIQSNTNPRKLIWINDPDGSSWSDYQNLITEGFIPAEPEIIDDSLLAGYEIDTWAIKGDYFIDTSQNPFGKFIKWVVGLFN